jgi:hypothetical protein
MICKVFHSIALALRRLVGFPNIESLMITFRGFSVNIHHDSYKFILKNHLIYRIINMFLKKEFGLQSVKKARYFSHDSLLYKIDQIRYI